MLTEADTCTRFVVPKLRLSGWDNDPHSFHEQHSFTDGRIFLIGNKVKRKQKKRADFLLQYTRDFTMAVVEAKSEDCPAGEGLQQAKDYAEVLGLKFAYATNGHHIIEFDYLTGQERELDEFPSPQDLWGRYTQGSGLQSEGEKTLLEPYNQTSGKVPRYYQQIAINRAVQCVLQDQKRILLTMATGTGKTIVAFNIAWKLWQSRWNLHTIVRLPKGVFAPYTSIPTNLLFFDRGASTKDVWYYEQTLPQGKKNYTKTSPIQSEEFANCIKWWTKRKENDRAWKVSAKLIIENGCNLDIKNPTAKEDLEHLSPAKLVESILEKEKRVLEIMCEIKGLLAEVPKR